MPQTLPFTLTCSEDSLERYLNFGVLNFSQFLLSFRWLMAKGALFNVTQLKIDCVYGDLPFTLPREVTHLKQLHSLVILDSSCNRLPAEFFTLGSLEYLQICDSILVNIPEDIVRLRHLKFINFSNNNLMSDGMFLPAGLWKLSALECLDLSFNPSISSLRIPINSTASNLRILDLSHTGLVEWPTGLSFLPSLKILYLSYTGITNIPDVVGDLRNLEFLVLNNLKLEKISFRINLLEKLFGIDCRRTQIDEAMFAQRLALLPRCCFLRANFLLIEARAYFRVALKVAMAFKWLSVILIQLSRRGETAMRQVFQNKDLLVEILKYVAWGKEFEPGQTQGRFLAKFHRTCLFYSRTEVHQDTKDIFLEKLVHLMVP